jgi:hypothetical protein
MRVTSAAICGFWIGPEDLALEQRRASRCEAGPGLPGDV